jgi:hypothetical protein
MGFIALAPLAIAAVSAVSKGLGEQNQANDAAQQVSTEARVRAANIRKLAAQTRSAARAGYAASGVTVDEGSAALTDRYITQQSELDAFYSVFSGDTKAASLRESGKAAVTGGVLEGAGSVLSTYAKRPPKSAPVTGPVASSGVWP